MTLIDLARVLDGNLNPLAKEAVRDSISKALAGRYEEFLRRAMFSTATTAVRDMGVSDVVAELPPEVVLEPASAPKFVFRVLLFVLSWLTLGPMVVMLLVAVGLFELAPRMVRQTWQDLMGELVPPKGRS